MQQQEIIRQFFEENIPFNTFLGLELVSINSDKAIIKVPFKDELIGDPRRPALHGGVISTLLDTAGGAIAMYSLDWNQETLSTLDMRVDYLLPGKPLDLYAEAAILRKGNKVIVTQMWAYHLKDKLTVAEGRGVYNVSRRRD